MHRHALTIALMSACSSTPAPDTAPPLPPAAEAPADDAADADQVCATGDAFACIAARRAQCTADTRVWRIEERVREVPVPIAYVSEHGLYMREVGNRRSFTVDGERWLGCMPGCLADGGVACVPVDDGKVKHSDDTRCKLLDDKATWEGRTVSLYECGQGEAILRIYIDPALDDVSRAVTRIRGGSRAINELEGLDVAWLHGEDEARRQNVTRADCSVFALPEGTRTFTSERDLAGMASWLPEYRARHQASHKQRRRAVAEQMVQDLVLSITRDLAQLCFDDDEPHTRAELDACFGDKPQLVPQAEEISQRHFNARLSISIEADIEAAQLLTVDYCRHFVD